MNNDTKKEIKKFMITQCLFGLAVFICCFQNTIRSYNSTMLALSYEYGFTSRALLGTIYHMLNNLPFLDMMSYQSAFILALTVTIIFFLYLMYFSYFCVKNSPVEVRKPVEALLLFLNTFIISTFSGGYNFFRIDLFLITVALLSAQIIAKNHFIYLTIPLSAIGVMFHQGFVFMYFNISLVLLLYISLCKEGSVRKKHLFIFITSFIICSALFLWFEFFSRTNGHNIFDKVVQDARMVSLDGKYHTSLLEHEVLGMDVRGAEAEWHKMVVIQLLYFTILMLPFLLIFAKFFIRIFKNASAKIDKIKYTLILIGAGTMLPDFILQIDFGRWVLAVITYYIVVIIMVVILGDTIIKDELIKMYNQIKQKPYSMLFFIYPILFIPLYDVDINALTKTLVDLTNNIFNIFIIPRAG